MPGSSTPSSPPSNPGYRGRFAPSPTGPLHLGSLIAAVASYLDARHHNGVWLVRIDDLDPPREIPGAAQGILDTLEQHGLHWDEEVLWQSERAPAYHQALALLGESDATFRCDCTRATLGPGGVCQRQCRLQQARVNTPAAVRITVPPATAIAFSDQLQGRQHIPLGEESGNFIVHRKDGLFAYQLAVVVDDAFQGVTHIVRGSDLLGTTAKQIFLQRCLGFATPHYSHIPVITDARGYKFSKQNHTPALEPGSIAANLRQALLFLGQPEPPAALKTAPHILQFAVANWSLERVPRTMSVTAT